MGGIDTWREAGLIAERHGTMAELIAHIRVDNLKRRGDPAGSEASSRIMYAMKALRRCTREAAKVLVKDADQALPLPP